MLIWHRAVKMVKGLERYLKCKIIKPGYIVFINGNIMMKPLWNKM
jgi:hypothetical protein